MKTLLYYTLFVYIVDGDMYLNNAHRMHVVFSQLNGDKNMPQCYSIHILPVLYLSCMWKV